MDNYDLYYESCVKECNRQFDDYKGKCGTKENEENNTPEETNVNTPEPISNISSNNMQTCVLTQPPMPAHLYNQQLMAGLGNPQANYGFPNPNMLYPNPYQAMNQPNINSPKLTQKPMQESQCNNSTNNENSDNEDNGGVLPNSPVLSEDVPDDPSYRQGKKTGIPCESSNIIDSEYVLNTPNKKTQVPNPHEDMEPENDPSCISGISDSENDSDALSNSDISSIINEESSSDTESTCSDCSSCSEDSSDKGLVPGEVPVQYPLNSLPPDGDYKQQLVYLPVTRKTNNPKKNNC